MLTVKMYCRGRGFRGPGRRGGYRGPERETFLSQPRGRGDGRWRERGNDDREEDDGGGRGGGFRGPGRGGYRGPGRGTFLSLTQQRSDGFMRHVEWEQSGDNRGRGGMNRVLGGCRGRGSRGLRGSYQNCGFKEKRSSKNQDRYIDFSNIQFGFRQLEILIKKEPSDILMTFTKQSLEFRNFLMNLNLKPDIIVLFVNCLSKICDSTYYENKLAILMKVCRSPFIDCLCKYFLKLSDYEEEQDLYWKDVYSFWINILKIYNEVMDLSPTTAYDCLLKLVDITKLPLEELKNHKDDDKMKDIFQSFENVKLKKKALSAKVFTEMKNKLADRKPSGEAIDVPDDYKSIDILPNAKELNSYNVPFLRPNIMDGEYASTNHYLDVQFRLMREDYISPMRESIRSFRKDPKQRRYNGGRFYKNVTFSHYTVSESYVGVMTKFSNCKLVPRSVARRFLFGSLLCFTDDNFENVFFGTIVYRKDELLLKGKIVVDLWENNLNEKIFHKSFTMFESDVFYMQYGPVLQILKDFENHVPMEKYIVKMEVSENPPLYLNDFSYLDGFIKKQKDTLDKYQFNVFEKSLKTDFVIIQGPPGTGKTYLGLKIASAILNIIKSQEIIRGPRCIINSSRMFPILILCYTNHALDQFLEGLIRVTKSIVRIGGQSKNEEFAKEYNLQNWRKQSRFSNAHKSTLVDVVKEIQTFQYIFESLDDDEIILDVEVFEKYLPDFMKYKNKLECEFKSDKRRSYLVNWLLVSDNVSYLRKFKNVSLTVEETIDEADDYEDISVMSRNLDDFENFNALDDDFDHKIILNNFHVKKLELILKNWNLEPNKQLKKSEYEKTVLEVRFLKSMLSQNFKTSFMNLDSLEISKLPARLRWKVYHQWKLELTKIIWIKMSKLQISYRRIFKLYEEVNQMRDADILKEAKFVGVTTTGAARLRSSIASLAPKIVIVEEAAEVLESHIVANLTSACQHLILIGDHQQLRPSTASYKLGKKFNLEISLFERMFKNEKNCYRLAIQHRMRPEISKLITPSIYSVLEDHESVKKYSPVKGVSKSLYFINHTNFEEMDDVINSFKNTFEAEFLLSLAMYFLQQGYKPEEITILTAYSGQMFYLQKMKKMKEKLSNVNINILDNFQGEENKIILLSLVRSNNEDKVGFLSTPNRICVALSRAREGFFIIGNMGVLERVSELWKTIHATLRDQESIGSSLPLICQNHYTNNEVSCSEDFLNKVPEGGCALPCRKLLSCSHICPNICHIDFDNHKSYKCIKNCERSCDLGHTCQLLCYKECKCMVPVSKTLPCGHLSKLVQCHLDVNSIICRINVEVLLTRCSHKVNVFCDDTRKKSNEELKCWEPCIYRLPCGHACENKCHVNVDPEHLDVKCMKKCLEKNKGCTENHECEKKCYQDCDLCMIKIKKKRSACKHSEEIECHVNINTTKCRQNCARPLPCGHACKKKCFDICGDCKVLVKKIRSCGHEMEIPCGNDVESFKCKRRCALKLKCGHQCKDKCGETCGKTHCFEMVNNPFETICGHSFKIPCSFTNEDKQTNKLILAKYCDVKCPTILKHCDHACAGVCGTCLGRLHVPCITPCNARLICGHNCSHVCREGCRICTMSSNIQCNHFTKDFKCGVTSIPCQKPCARKCEHGKCTMKCGEKCNIRICSVRCTKKLGCGHNCISLCEEKCPQICSICEPDKLPEDIFHVGYDIQTRFIYLVDCHHLVEAKNMDRLVNEYSNSNEIGYPPCPYCTASIINTPRYSNTAKNTFKAIQQIIMCSFGTKADSMEDMKTIAEMITKLKSKEVAELFNRFPVWEKMINSFGYLYRDLEKHMNDKGKTLQVNKADIQNFKSKLNILNELSDIVIKNKSFTEETYIYEQISYILNAFLMAGKKCSQQQIDDFYKELLRMAYLFKLTKIKAKDTDIIKLNGDLTKLENMIVFSNSPLDAKCSNELDAIFAKYDNDTIPRPINKDMDNIKMGFKQGYWYKCFYGHTYCVTDCGEDNPKNVCPKCKLTSAGTRTQKFNNNKNNLPSMQKNLPSMQKKLPYNRANSTKKPFQSRPKKGYKK